MALLLKSFAGVGVAYSRREEAEAEGQHDDVQHEMLLCAVIRAGESNDVPAFVVVRCHPAHRFSRRE
jgi:hypothetical protein